MSNQIQELFDLANEAKSVGHYEIANKVFCILAYMKLNGESSLRFVYEWIGERWGDLIEHLANPHDDCNGGYYDLPAVADSNGNYLCIPLPLLSREFMNKFVMAQPEFTDQAEHREYVEMEEAGKVAFAASLHERLSAFAFDFSIDEICASFLQQDREEQA